MRVVVDGPHQSAFEALLAVLPSLLRRHGLVMMAVAAISLTVASLAVALMGPRYSSEALVQLSFTRESPAPGASSQQIANVDGTTMVETAARLIRSRGTARAVVDRLHLADDPAFVRPSRLAGLLEGILPAGMLPKPVPEDVATGTLLSSLRVSYEPRSYLITINCTLGSAQRAATVANAVALEYLRAQYKTRLMEDVVVADRQLAELARTFGERHPRYEHARERLDKLRSQVAMLGSSTEPDGMMAAVAGETFIPATAVSVPSGPNVPLLLGLALLLALPLSVAVALTLDRWMDAAPSIPTLPAGSDSGPGLRDTASRSGSGVRTRAIATVTSAAATALALLRTTFNPASSAVASPKTADTSATSPHERIFEAHRFDGIAEFLAQADELGTKSALTPFQAAAWLKPFYAGLAPRTGVEPVLIGVREKSGGRVAMLLPLVLRRRFGVSVIEFADLDVCDYAFPVLGPAAPATAAAATDAWRAVLECLPRADLLRLDRQLVAAGETRNPLRFLATRPSTAIRNATGLPETWEAYLETCSKKQRKELRQKTKLMAQQDGAVFSIVTDPSEAIAIVGKLDAMQRARFHELGANFKLDHPPYDDFYREAVRLGIADGTLHLAILATKDEVIAAAMVLLCPGTGTIVRLSHVGGIWSRRSPSVVLTGLVIQWLIENGYRTFDFGTGHYAYKQRFGCEVLPLDIIEQPLTLKGRVAANVIAGAEALRASPLARTVAARLRRRAGRQPATADEAD